MRTYLSSLVFGLSFLTFAASASAQYSSSLYVGPNPNGASLGHVYCNVGLNTGYPGYSTYVYIALSLNGDVVAYVSEESYSGHVARQLDFTMGDGDDGTYECTADYFLEWTYLGSDHASTAIPRPDNQDVLYDYYTYQNAQDYNRYRLLGLKVGAYNYPVNGTSITEVWTSFSPNSCGISDHVTGYASTANGLYDDNYFLSFAGHPNACDVTPTCSSEATQNVQAAGGQVATYTVTYMCNEVTIQ